MRHKCKKILFLFSHTGSGHLTSAKAIEQEIRKQQEKRFDFEYLDFVGEFSKFLAIFERGYSPQIKYAPWTWGLLYWLLSNNLSLFLFKKIGAAFICKKLAKRIKNTSPAVIVSVHPLANLLTTDILRKEKSLVPFIVVVTDPVTFHKSWLASNKYLNISDQTAAAIVATEEGYQRGLTYGFPAEKLHKIGLPIRPEFYEKQAPKRHNDKFTVLFMGGGDGAGKILEIIHSLKKRRFTGKIIVICGNNQKLKTKLNKMRTNSLFMEMKIIGFTNKVKKFMDNSDLLITKAGPGTIAEAISRLLPLIIYYWVPGQETGNARYVQKQQLGYIIKKTSAITKQVIHLSRHPEILDSLRENLTKHRTPQATSKIAKLIIEHSNK